MSATQLNQDEPANISLNDATSGDKAISQQLNESKGDTKASDDLVVVAAGGGGCENNDLSHGDSGNKAPLPPPPTQHQQLTTANAKPNGLKNRIIQRPPPLVLDKVSNFYDAADANNCVVQTQRTQQQQQQQQTLPTNSISDNSNNKIATKPNPKQTYSQQSAAKNSKLNSSLVRPNNNNTSQLLDEAFINDRSSSNRNIGNSNNANQRFWASLNENASRNKALAQARGASALSASNTMAPLDTNPHHHHHSNGSANNETMMSSVDSLEPDLIIKHRNSSGAISSSRVVSTLVAQKQQQNQHHHRNHNQQLHHVNNDKLQNSADKTTAINLGQQVKDEHNPNDDLNENIRKDPLNISDDLEDCGESNGGNLVGVDTTTPPAPDLIPNRPFQSDEPPPSATGSRPRSTNPFLNENDDDFEEYRNSIRSESANRDSFLTNDQNNFHKRPASFIAATDRLTGVQRPTQDFVAKQKIVEEKLNEVDLNEQYADKSLHDLTGLPISQPTNVTNSDHIDGKIDYHPVRHIDQFQHITPQLQANDNHSIYKLHESHNNQGPTISVDSESTVRQPPPGATMLVPHWTDAIYDLDNAILESGSIAGGSDNGQFIHIVQSGDIILELDHIKVSGFTLGEFNQLVESKQFHLLRAVQTKHSRGLSLDLRDYLGQSFPRDSKDKQLQSTIRDNIYRRTIPCTTRPPKPGEVDKVDYYFLTKEQFNELNKKCMLLECGVYAGHFYGTLKPSCDLDQLSECLQSIQDEAPDRLRQAWDSNHPAVEMILKKDASNIQAHSETDHPVYENHESLRMQQQFNIPNTTHSVDGLPSSVGPSNVAANDSEALPPGWVRVVDQTHGTYYIDHNTRRTQFERPYEVELTKGSMGFGFTLVEADSGLLLVRSVIPGGPAHMNGSIRPGDILVSAVGVSVTGLLHTDIARLFSTFAVGDRVRLTFARSNYVLDENLVPDEYLFSNGTNGDLAIAVNPNNHQFNQNPIPQSQSPHIIVNQEFEYIKIVLKRGDQGFGFTISDSIAGQRVRKIQNHEVCANLKQGDILIDLNGENITGMAHKDVVERLKKCPPGNDVTLTVKRKKRFRSKTPMAMHTDASGEYSLDSTPQRNCKTPSLDGLMLKRPGNYNSDGLTTAARTLFQDSNQARFVQETPSVNTAFYDASLMNGLPPPLVNSFEQRFYGSLPAPRHQQQVFEENNSIDLHATNYSVHEQHSLPTLVTSRHNDQAPNESMPLDMKSGLFRVSSDPYQGNIVANPHLAADTNSNVPARQFSINDFDQINQYNNFMNNDKLMMMQMQQPRYQQQIYSSSDYHQMPLYSNSEIMNSELMPQQSEQLHPTLPIKPPAGSYLHSIPPPGDDYQNNFYANNEEIALQSMQYSYLTPASQVPITTDQFTFMRPMSQGTPHDEHDEYEYHNVDLEREDTDCNWGIRLIGGAEVDRAISIGSMIHGGVASKSGKLKSGDEIISIDGVNVVGAAHQYVVELISACTNRVSLVVRRKIFAEACDVVLTKNMDEGFGFVIISNENCALIGKIIEGSPADRCKQLRVRDCIIAVNGRYITPDMKHPEIVNMIKECGSTLRLRIIPVDCYTVKLIKGAQNDSFGFRMRGGSEYDDTPLYIVRVEPNGQAQGLLNVGDQILEINNIPTVGMTHQQAATIIKYSDPIVKLKLRRNYVTPQSLLVDSPRSLQKYNQTAEMKQVNLVSTPNNLTGVAHEVAFASLPTNVNLMSQPIQQQQHPMQVPILEQQGLQPNNHHHHQLICDQHSLVYPDQCNMYAT